MNTLDEVWASMELFSVVYFPDRKWCVLSSDIYT